MKNRRIGVFYIAASLVDGAPDIVQATYAACIPLRVELLAYRDAYQVYAISQHFAEISQGEMVPEYQVIHQNDRVFFERIRS